MEKGPDVLQDLFGNYVLADLKTAGASPDALKRLMDASDSDLAGRFEGIRPAWEATQFTGYGEAVRLIASEIYGLSALTPEGLASAREKLAKLRKPGMRYALLHDRANLDHVQTDDFSWACPPDASGPDFFLYDLSWAGFCGGNIDTKSIGEDTDIEVTDLFSLRRAMERLFEKHAPCAIAVKAQHAYNRTLLWEERSDEDAARALDATLASEGGVSEETRLCLGDWCWARGVELAIEHNLPFKLHTGYYAGNDRMPVDRIRSGNLCALLARYLDARFVLMHIAYPYNNELVGIAKHYPNVYVDLCWGLVHRSLQLVRLRPPLPPRRAHQQTLRLRRRHRLAHQFGCLCDAGPPMAYPGARSGNRRWRPHRTSGHAGGHPVDVHQPAGMFRPGRNTGGHSKKGGIGGEAPGGSGRWRGRHRNVIPTSKRRLRGLPQRREHCGTRPPLQTRRRTDYTLGDIL